MCYEYLELFYWKLGIIGSEFYIFYINLFFEVCIYYLFIKYEYIGNCIYC